MFDRFIKHHDLPDFLWEQARYDALNVRISLRVRRQINTGEKFLCSCPVRGPSSEYDVEVARHLRASPPIPRIHDRDMTVESRCSRDVVYRLSRATACTYEMDDAPPSRVNPDVVSRVTALAKAMVCVLPDYAEVMRTQVLDGSMPSGFQRSILAGWGCRLPFLGKSLDIQEVIISEDSARLVDITPTQRVFMTDRLGIPMVEITTQPSITSPAEVAVAAELLRQITASVPDAAHGQPALRFDMRVSIKGGDFVEIRGLHGVRDVAVAAHYEVVRQQALAKLAGELGARGIHWDRMVQRDISRIAGVLKKTKSQTVQAVLLPGFRGVMRQQLGPGRDLLDEFVERVSATACIQQDMVLCSEGEEIFVLSRVFAKASDALNARRSDVVFLIVGAPQNAHWGVVTLKESARQVYEGIAPEIRRPLEHGESQFLQPQTVYGVFPESELPPIHPVPGREPLDMPWDVFAKLVRHGLSEQQAGALLVHRKCDLFYDLESMGFSPTAAAHMALRYRKRPEILLKAAKKAVQTTTEPAKRIKMINREMRNG